MKDQFEDLVKRMHQGGIRYEEAVREFKKAYITAALRENYGNLSQTAPRLRLHRNTLSRAIRQLGVDLKDLRAQRRPPRRETLGRIEKREAR